MKLKLLFMTLALYALSLQASTNICGLIINDTFDEAGALPSEWTEYNTSGRITVENGYMKFNHNTSKPSAYRTFSPVSDNVTFTFDVQGSRSAANFQIDLLSADSNVIASIAIGKGTADFKYATEIGSYTAGVGGSEKFKTNTKYSIYVSVDFSNQTVNFYFDGALTLENIPFLETADNLAKIDMQLLYMYNNNGTFFVDNVKLITASEDKISLMSLYEDALDLFNESAIDQGGERFEQAITAAGLVLGDCNVSADSVAAILTDLQNTMSSFETRLGLAEALSSSEKLLARSSVGSHYTQYPQTDFESFEHSISDANAVLANADATVEDMSASLTQIQTAQAAFLAAHNDPVVLTLYSEYNFSGEEKELKCGYYNGTLGDFDDKTVSFKLDSGYMVTFAQEVNGLGVSKVYIAQDHGIEINLPEKLQSSISFLRVSPWYATGKKGSLGDVKWTAADLYNTTWHYNWGLGTIDSDETYTVPEVEFVPMSWSKSDTWTSLDKMEAIGKNMAYNHHMAFNEPDNEDQSNLTVAQALEAYPKLLASGLRLGAPGVENISYSTNNDAFNDGAWIKEFLDSCEARGYRVDFIPAHDYVRRSTSSFMERFKALYERYGVPVWVTEYNYGNPNMGSANLTVEEGYAKIKPMTEALEEAEYIERYNWYYFFGASSGIGGITDGELNITGQFYRDLESQSPSYIQETYEQGPYIETAISNSAEGDEELIIYPNPVSTSIFTIGSTALSHLASYELNIFDINGRIVLHQDQAKPEVDITHLSNGFYILKLRSNNKQLTQNLIIQK